MTLLGRYALGLILAYGALAAAHAQTAAAAVCTTGQVGVARSEETGVAGQGGKFSAAESAALGTLGAPIVRGEPRSDRYILEPREGDKGMPAAPFRTETMLKRAAPTSQWYSTLIFNPEPDPIFVQPMTVRTTMAGFEMELPSKVVNTTRRRGVEISYPHCNPLVISPVAFEPGVAKLAGQGDWSIDVSFARGADDMRVTVAHGNPYAFFKVSRGDLRVKLPAIAERFDSGADARVLALRVMGKSYGLFAPTGARWESVSPTEWIARMPANKGYLSVAVLPDDKAETLSLFTRHAYAFVEDTRVDWRYDAPASQIETNFVATTRTMEGADNGPLLGLYPHQWFGNASVEGKLGPAYETVRGQIRLLAAPQFKTTNAYIGFVPYWPAVGDAPRKEQLADVMKTDLRTSRRMMLQEGKGAYWQGKGLQRNVKLLDVVEQHGDAEGRERLLAMLKTRIEEWFSGTSSRGYFLYDSKIGAVASYPDEFFTVEQINDHHFTYGYWIRAVADIALRDPAWAAEKQLSRMVDLLVADIATAERGRADFPFLRNFDPYEGHSWATGVGGVGSYGAWGNNQEASSEAMNAWAGLILWGEITGNRALRDVGAYMYATEANAISHYWFDVHGVVFPPEFKSVDASQVFGGQFVRNTWWTDEPRQIKGINLLPVTTSSLYLAYDPKYVQRNLDALQTEMDAYWFSTYGFRPANSPPRDIWQDVFAKYMALADPAQGLAQWNRWGAVELGETRTNTLHWLLSLNETGPPDFSVHADTALYSVFKRADGRRTYLAFNAGKAPLKVRFSDGKALDVAPGQLARAN